MSTPTNSADASCGELSCDECNARTAALMAERDQLRAEVELDEALQLATERSLKNAIARAERAEAEVGRLRAGIAECLHTNGHLADGEDCTLIGLKRCLRSDLALRRYTKQQVIEFAKKNVATNDYAFGERSGGYIITESKDNISKQK